MYHRSNQIWLKMTIFYIYILLQIYSQTVDSNNDDFFYSELQGTLKQIPKKDLLHIMGNFNAKLGQGEVARIVGKFRARLYIIYYKASNRLMQFCQENHLNVLNMWFIQHKWQLYTWEAPNRQHWNQIGFTVCQQCWKGSIAMEDHNGNVPSDQQKIKNSWKECTAVWLTVMMTITTAPLINNQTSWKKM